MVKKTKNKEKGHALFTPLTYEIMRAAQTNGNYVRPGDYLKHKRSVNALGKKGYINPKGYITTGGTKTINEYERLMGIKHYEKLSTVEDAVLALATIPNKGWSPNARFELLKLCQRFQVIKDTDAEKVLRTESRILNEVMNRVETLKGLSGKMSMGEWSSKMLEMLGNWRNSVIKEMSSKINDSINEGINSNHLADHIIKSEVRPHALNEPLTTYQVLENLGKQMLDKIRVLRDKGKTQTSHGMQLAYILLRQVRDDVENSFTGPHYNMAIQSALIADLHIRYINAVRSAMKKAMFPIRYSKDFKGDHPHVHSLMNAVENAMAEVRGPEPDSTQEHENRWLTKSENDQLAKLTQPKICLTRSSIMKVLWNGKEYDVTFKHHEDEQKMYDWLMQQDSTWHPLPINFGAKVERGWVWLTDADRKLAEQWELCLDSGDEIYGRRKSDHAKHYCLKICGGFSESDLKRLKSDLDDRKWKPVPFDLEIKEVGDKVFELGYKDAKKALKEFEVVDTDTDGFSVMFDGGPLSYWKDHTRYDVTFETKEIRERLESMFKKRTSNPMPCPGEYVIKITKGLGGREVAKVVHLKGQYEITEVEFEGPQSGNTIEFVDPIKGTSDPNQYQVMAALWNPTKEQWLLKVQRPGYPEFSVTCKENQFRIVVDTMKEKAKINNGRLEPGKYEVHWSNVPKVVEEGDTLIVNLNGNIDIKSREDGDEWGSWKGSAAEAIQQHHIEGNFSVVAQSMKPDKWTFEVDGEIFENNLRFINGQDLNLKLLEVKRKYNIFAERNAESDEQITPHIVYDLERSTKFYTVPPASFGNDKNLSEAKEWRAMDDNVEYQLVGKAGYQGKLKRVYAWLGFKPASKDRFKCMTTEQRDNLDVSLKCGDQWLRKEENLTEKNSASNLRWVNMDEFFTINNDNEFRFCKKQNGIMNEFIVTYSNKDVAAKINREVRMHMTKGSIRQLPFGFMVEITEGEGDKVVARIYKDSRKESAKNSSQPSDSHLPDPKVGDWIKIGEDGIPVMVMKAWWDRIWEHWNLEVSSPQGPSQRGSWFRDQFEILLNVQEKPATVGPVIGAGSFISFKIKGTEIVTNAVKVKNAKYHGDKAWFIDLGNGNFGNFYEDDFVVINDKTMSAEGRLLETIIILEGENETLATKLNQAESQITDLKHKIKIMEPYQNNDKIYNLKATDHSKKYVIRTDDRPGESDFIDGDLFRKINPEKRQLSFLNKENGHWERWGSAAYEMLERNLEEGGGTYLEEME
jgi:hypothetical protein